MNFKGKVTCGSSRTSSEMGSFCLVLRVARLLSFSRREVPHHEALLSNSQPGQGKPKTISGQCKYADVLLLLKA